MSFYAPKIEHAPTFIAHRTFIWENTTPCWQFISSCNISRLCFAHSKSSYRWSSLYFSISKFYKLQITIQYANYFRFILYPGLVILIKCFMIICNCSKYAHIYAKFAPITMLENYALFVTATCHSFCLRQKNWPAYQQLVIEF